MAVTAFLIFMVRVSKSQIMAGNITLTSSRTVDCGIRWDFWLRKEISAGYLVLSNVDNLMIWWFFGWVWKKSWEEEKKLYQMGFMELRPLWKSGHRVQFFSKPQNQSMEKRVRARHEHCNRRMKQWAILRQEFRHDLTHHESVFCAIAVMTQLCIQNGEPLATVS